MQAIYEPDSSLPASRGLSYFLLASLIFLACNEQEKRSSIQAIEVTRKSVIHDKMPATLINTSFFVYKKDQLMMYSYFYRFDSIVNNVRIFSEKRKAYFVFHKDSLFGYHYDPNSHKQFQDNVRLPVDSMHLRLNDVNCDSLAYRKPDSTWQVNKEFNELYRYAANGDTPAFRITLSYRKDFTGIDESFSRLLDSVKHMKLIRAELFMPRSFLPKSKLTAPQTTILNEIQEITVDDENEVTDWFKKYEDKLSK
jgi:hypothetical protein